MAGQHRPGTTSRPLFPCHFHLASPAFATRFGEPAHPLQHPFSGGLGDPAHDCRRPASTRCATWLPGRTPHLEPADGSPCPSALPGPRRRTLCRSLAVDSDTPATLLPAWQGAQRALPTHLPVAAQSRLPAEETTLSGAFARLQKAPEFDGFFRQLKRQHWVVHAKKPFGGLGQVLKYLARYTHRVAISNGRLISMQDGRVTFRWRDSAHGNQTKLMTLDAVEFIRRFLLHVLPPGFVKIRHFGFLANPQRRDALKLCRMLLPIPEPPHPVTDVAPNTPQRRCPCCGVGTLCLIGWVPAGAPLLTLALAAVAAVDTS